MLMRNTSAPASNSRAIIALSDEAGPSVATILVRRSRLIVSGFRLRRGGATAGAAGVVICGSVTGDRRARRLLGRFR